MMFLVEVPEVTGPIAGSVEQIGYLCIQGYPKRICSGCTSACNEPVFAYRAAGEAEIRCDAEPVYPETDSVMDREDYWNFVETTPPEGMYGYERLDDDPRWFRVRVEAETPDQAEMRAVQVAKHLGTTEAISGGIVEPPSEGLWIVQIEGW